MIRLGGGGGGFGSKCVSTCASPTETSVVVTTVESGVGFPVGMLGWSDIWPGNLSVGWKVNNLNAGRRRGQLIEAHEIGDAGEHGESGGPGQGPIRQHQVG